MIGQKKHSWFRTELAYLGQPYRLGVLAFCGFISPFLETSSRPVLVSPLQTCYLSTWQMMLRFQADACSCEEG